MKLLELFDAINEAASGVTIQYRGQSKVAVKPRRAREDVLMTIPTQPMDAAFKRDGPSFYVGSGGSGAAIGDRYARFQQWIEENQEYEVPEVYVDEKGRMSFTNGRHRYAVLRDAGVDPMPVAMSPEAVKNAQQLLKAKLHEVWAGTPSREAAQQISQAIQNSPHIALKAGTLVYHGTDADEGQEMFRRPEDYDGGWPLWTTPDKSDAAQYAEWQRSGDIGVPQVITFRVTRSVTLTLLDDHALKTLPELMGSINIQTLGGVVCELGFSGWVNQGEFNEVMLCNPSEFLEFIDHEFVDPVEQDDDWDDIDKAFESLSESILDALPPGARKLATGLAMMAALSGAHGHESELEHPPRHPSVTLHSDFAERLGAMADIIGAENPDRYGQWISNLMSVYKKNPLAFERMFGVDYAKFLDKARNSTPQEMGAYMKDVAQSYKPTKVVESVALQVNKERTAKGQEFEDTRGLTEFDIVVDGARVGWTSAGKNEHSGNVYIPQLHLDDAHQDAGYGEATVRELMQYYNAPGFQEGQWATEKAGRFWKHMHQKIGEATEQGLDLSSLENFVESLKRLPKEAIVRLQAIWDKLKDESVTGLTELYHGAPRDVAGDIKSGGFSLTTGQRSGFMGAVNKVSNQGIFLTDDRGMANYFGSNRSKHDYDYEVFTVYVDTSKVLDAEVDAPLKLRKLGVKLLHDWDGKTRRKIPIREWWWLLDDPVFVDAVKLLGYTGVMFREDRVIRKAASSEGNTYMIFDPSTIKQRGKDTMHNMRGFYEWLVRNEAARPVTEDAAIRTYDSGVLEWLQEALSRPDADDLYLHGSRQVQDVFSAGDKRHEHSLLHFSKLTDPQFRDKPHHAEYYGPKLLLCKLNYKKPFDVRYPDKEPAQMHRELVPRGRKYQLDYGDIYHIIEPALAKGYDMFVVWEVSVSTESYAVPSANQVQVIDTYDSRGKL